MMTFFTIIIPVRTVNDYLEESILYLKKLDHPSFEVIIVMDALEEYPFNDSRFRIISSGTVGPGEKRNIGVSHALGSIVAFLDDDAYPKSDWLKEAEKIFDQNPDLYALGAPALTPSDIGFLEKMSGKIYESFLASGGTTYRYVAKECREVADYPTVNLFVKKDAFEKVGGFPIEFWPGEDTKLCLDLVKEYGKPFLYDPRPIVYHHRRNVLLQHLKQVSRYGQHRGQFAKIFPETSRLPSYFVPSLFVLGLLFGPLVASLVPSLWYFYFFTLAVYFLLLLLESSRTAFEERSIKGFFYIYLGIFLTHIIYGINFIRGYVKKPSLNLRGVDKETGNYIGG